MAEDVKIIQIISYANHPDFFEPVTFIHGEDQFGNDYFGKVAWIKKPEVNSAHQGFNFANETHEKVAISAPIDRVIT